MRISDWSPDVCSSDLKSDGFYPNSKAGAADAARMYADTEWGALRRGALPGNLMADAILDSDEPVRAMIVVAGNPLLATGGAARSHDAPDQLALMVYTDLYRNAPGELAHHSPHPPDKPEVSASNITGIGLNTDKRP